MHPISVMISPELEQTRLLVMGLESELLTASLPSLPMVEPRALPTMLEGLALAFQQRLSVVLVADDRVGSYCSATFAALVETRPLFYDVGIAAREAVGPVPPEIVPGSFEDLRAFRGVRR